MVDCTLPKLPLTACEVGTTAKSHIARETLADAVESSDDLL
jgi:hypothetical protein